MEKEIEEEKTNFSEEKYKIHQMYLLILLLGYLHLNVIVKYGIWSERRSWSTTNFC